MSWASQPAPHPASSLGDRSPRSPVGTFCRALQHPALVGGSSVVQRVPGACTAWGTRRRAGRAQMQQERNSVRIWPEALLPEPRFIPAGCFPLPLAPSLPPVPKLGPWRGDGGV